MPYASFHVSGAPLDDAARNRLHRGATDLIERIFDAPRKIVAIRIVDDTGSEWSVGGEILTSREDPGRTGIIARVTISEASATGDRLETAIAELSAMLKALLGSNALPPYIVFDLIPERAWGFRNRSLAAIRAAST